MHPDVTVPDDDFEATHERSSLLGITFVEFGFLGSGRGEGHGFSTEPGGEEEGADDGHGVEGRHPHLSSGVALRETVAGWEVGDPFVEPGQHEICEGEADLPPELGVVDVCNELTAGDEDDWDGEEGDAEEDLEECVDGEDECGKTGEERHVFNEVPV